MSSLSNKYYFNRFSNRLSFFNVDACLLRVFYKLLPHVLFLVVAADSLFAQQGTRLDISLDKSWRTTANDTNQNLYAGFEKQGFNDAAWMVVDVPHNWDAYEGYRRKLHGNRHGYAWYRKNFSLEKKEPGKRYFFFFEGVGSYATVWLNGSKVSYHPGGRTTFTIDVTNYIQAGKTNIIAVRADHPAGIKDLPWVCGGCSDERGFSEGSQPMGIFRPVHLIVTNSLRIEPFGVHVWNDTTATEKSAQVFVATEIKNYNDKAVQFTVHSMLLDHQGKLVTESFSKQELNAGSMHTVAQSLPAMYRPRLWNIEDPYLYSLVSEVKQNDVVIDRITTAFGIRTISWQMGNPNSTHQFLLNGKPVFINGIAEYEHLLGSSHAFSSEEIRARVMQVKAAGFNAFRDAHHPHNLRYQNLLDSLGILWWTQLSAHVWYDSREFRNNFKQLLTDWVKERRNSPSLVLYGLQNESKLPADFALECTELIRSLDPTASSQRLITTCNGGSGTDWDVPQNWTGTYGGNPATYGEDLKRQILVGEYGAWRTLDLHSEAGFVQNAAYSEDRMTQLMEMKLRLAESVKDSVAGHFMWLLTSHDNPGRVQGGEGFRAIDRIGPVNYKGLLTPWEEPLDAFYMYRSNYAPKEKEPMVYIVSHTWPDRWTKPGMKNNLIVYSNCDEVELFNDVRTNSLGRKKKGAIGTHFQWDSVAIKYNILYALGYVNGKEVAHDCIVLNHLDKAPHFDVLNSNAKNITKPQSNYQYLYRVNCGGAAYKDVNGNVWMADRERKQSKTWGSTSWTSPMPDMPVFFASQRSTNDPVLGTRDWKLFQTFRYGRQQLQYQFPVKDGEYLVELYFMEPWWGTGGGLNAGGFRLFDVAVNGKTYIRNLDLWKEVGHDVALKRTIKVVVHGGLLTISFPKIEAGQAVISGIAIATTDKLATVASSPQPLATLLGNTHRITIHDWLNTGDTLQQGSEKIFSALPPDFYGAQWLQYNAVEHPSTNANQALQVNDDADMLLALDSITSIHASYLKGFSNTSTYVELGDASKLLVFKKRFQKGEQFEWNSSNLLLAMVPASNMEPAYDLKPVTSYKVVQAKWFGAGVVKGQVDGKDRIIFEKASRENAIEWNITTGVADMYSLTVAYNNANSKSLHGTLQFLMADGTLMKEEKVEFTPTRPGKSNYIVSNTGSMINAGHYIVRLKSPDAENLSVNTLDVQ